MKKCSKLLVFVLILSLSIGVTAFAASCPLRSGSITGKGTLDRINSKSGSANTSITSNHLYYTTTTIMAYNSKGVAIGGNANTSRTASSTYVNASKKVNCFKSSHSIKDNNYRPYCSNYLIVY